MMVETVGDPQSLFDGRTKFNVRIKVSEQWFLEEHGYIKLFIPVLSSYKGYLQDQQDA